MKVTTTARHCELDTDVRTFVQQRMERLQRYFRDPNDLMEAHVVVVAEKYRHAAEVTLKLRLGEFVGREQADDPRTAVDLAAGRIEAQIRREKGKRQDRKRLARGHAAVAPAEGPAVSGDESFEPNVDEVTDRSDRQGAGPLPMDE